VQRVREVLAQQRVKSVVTRLACSVSSSCGGDVGAVAAPKRSGNSSEAPSPNVNAIGGEPEKTSAGCGSRISRANVSQQASRSRWKCTQPFGTPVVPLVKAMIATSSAAVSQASNHPRVGRSSITSTSSTSTSLTRRRATSALVTFALATTLSISRARSSGIVATTIPPASRIPSQQAIASGVLGECSRTRSPRSMFSAPATASARSASSA
jgi:hypothetical protein